MNREPIFNVPGTVLAILAVLIAVHAVMSFLTPDQFMWWLLALAFIPARYSGLAGELPGGDVSAITSWISHMLVHADITHLVFNSAWMLAFGSVLCARLGEVAFWRSRLRAECAVHFCFSLSILNCWHPSSEQAAPSPR